MSRLILFLFFFLTSIPFVFGQANVIERKAMDSITPAELNIGDTLRFTLRNGDVRTLVVKKTGADVIITNLSELKEDQSGGALLYHITAEVEVDGQPMKMERYVGSQETFYEPYVINGMRIWFDAVINIGEVINDNHGGGGTRNIPHKDARFAISDMTDTIAPQEISPWYENKENFISIANSYRGDDPWMGPYNGTEIHGGLDINFSPGTPNFAPIPIDDHYFFNSLEGGQNNNRWRGIRQWDNGHTWTLQNHHMLNLRVPEHTPIESGSHYADAGGVFSGANHHAHYIFKIKSPKEDHEILLDPWIIFWETFENNKDRAGEIRASIGPVSPGHSGENVAFRGDQSKRGVHRSELTYFWTFGDGGVSSDVNPEHTYAKPGIYPVTLTVEDGANKDSFTQHITIDGEKVEAPALALAANDIPSFRKRPVHMMDTYGIGLRQVPHSVHFLARPSRPKPDAKIIKLQNNGGGVLPDVEEPVIVYMNNDGWLSVEPSGNGNQQKLNVQVNAEGLSTGVYSARVEVKTPGALNEQQEFRVNLTVPTYPPSHRSLGNQDQDGNHVEVIHHTDQRFHRVYKTPYFWVGPQFERWEEKGYGDYYLTNGGRSGSGEFVRFTPDLEEGRYEISFATETPFDPKKRAVADGQQYPVNLELNPDPRFKVRVHSKNGDEIIWMEPINNRVIGTFEFHEGMDGFVEILAEDAKGQVLVDAVIFRKIGS